MEFLASLHPKTVHFPVAILIVYVIFELGYLISNKEFLSKSAHLLLFIGVIMSVAAVLTGNQAEEVAERLIDLGVILPHDIIEEHQEFATITLWYFVFILILRTFLHIRKKLVLSAKILLVVLAFIGSFLIYKTGELGGELVYRYGIGTDLINQQAEID